ncbi:histidine kinase [Aquabacterium sp. A7-Y]|uniref:hybrid sensor histidine kinase/response regulator n=1 Tax=Aquabacterium sp. A7-Y TaxID=1349605 RepID=UPI00223E6B1A|nr:histidine kinase [Aquabacterium sp. A7-Y]MCW7536551.1 histidine kinase [Aquabacterium sp. A7-Y]
MLRMVCIEDEEDDVELVRLALWRGGMDAVLERVADEPGLRRCLAEKPDLLLCDYSMPGFSAERALALLAEGRHDVPLVVVTRAIGEEAVVQLFRAGAKDYVAKDKLALLPSVITRVLQARALEQERRRTAEQLRSAYERLRVLSARVVDAQERERALIARDLHDGLGQLLTGIVIHLHAAGRSGDPEKARHCSERAAGMAQEAIQQVKSLSFDLRPAQLELLGFSAAVQATVDRRLENSGATGYVRVRGQEGEGGRPSYAVALRVLQEALTNVVRHAGASSVVVRLRFVDPERLVMTVADDGCGFDVRQTLAGGISERNFGLYGMAERAELGGGRIRWRSRPGRGTVLQLFIA